MNAHDSERKHGSPFWRKLIVIFAGGTILAVGLAMLVLPGPAIVFIPLGLAILATEFQWARKWLLQIRQWVRSPFKKSDQSKERTES